MKLRPHEILNHLGFDVPEDGVDINPNDAFITTSALRLAGETIDFSKVDEAKLTEIHHGVAFLGKRWVDGGLVSALPISEAPPSPESLQKLAMMLEAILKFDFKHRKTVSAG